MTSVQGPQKDDPEKDPTGPAIAQERTPAGAGSAVREVPPAVQAPLITAAPEAGRVGDSSDRLALRVALRRADRSHRRHVDGDALSCHGRLMELTSAQW